MALAAWGGLGIGEIVPDAGGWPVAAVIAALVLTRLLPPGMAGVIWFVSRRSRVSRLRYCTGPTRRSDSALSGSIP